MLRGKGKGHKCGECVRYGAYDYMDELCARMIHKDNDWVPEWVTPGTRINGGFPACPEFEEKGKQSK